MACNRSASENLIDKVRIVASTAAPSAPPLTSKTISIGITLAAFIPQLLDRFRTEAEDILMMARMQLGVVRTTSRRLPRTRRKFLIDLPGRLAERQSEEIPYRDGTM